MARGGLENPEPNNPQIHPDTILVWAYSMPRTLQPEVLHFFAEDDAQPLHGHLWRRLGGFRAYDWGLVFRVGRSHLCIAGSPPQPHLEFKQYRV